MQLFTSAGSATSHISEQLNNLNTRLLFVVILRKSRFLGLHLRVDKGCLLGKKGDQFMGRTSVGALGYQGSGKTDVQMAAHIYMLYMYVCVHMCMLVFRVLHGVTSSVILHLIF